MAMTQTQMIQIHLKEHGNLPTAQKWNELTDRYVFCLDITGTCIESSYSDRLVNALEDRFEEILEENGVPVKE